MRFSKGILASFILTITLGFIAGCTDSNGDFVFTNGNQVGAAPATFNLRVAADPAALARGILAQIGTDATQFRITIFDLNAQQVGQQTVARNGTASFNLPSGNYLIRMEGLNAANAVIGYFDRLEFLNANTNRLIPGLRLTNAPPAPNPTNPGNPFIIFTASPAAPVGGTPFSVSGRLFSANGDPFTTPTGGISLTSAPIGFTGTPANQTSDANGNFTFANLQFPGPSNGATTLTLAVTGFDNGTAVLNVTAAPALAASMELVSQTDAMAQGNAASGGSDISSDGRFVVIQSSADNLVAGDTNGQSDIFVYDRTNDTIERVSVSSAGVQGNAGSFGARISGNGRYVCFASLATNLVTGDTNGQGDIFVHDRDTNTTERVSINDAGAEADDQSRDAAISDDGRYVSFISEAGNLSALDGGNFDAFVYDRTTDTIELVSVTNAGAGTNFPVFNTDISADGRYVTFISSSPDLGSLGGQQVFVFDRTTDMVEVVSVDNAGNQSNNTCNRPYLSGNGQFVAFTSTGTNLVTGDTNGSGDVFVHDRTANTTIRASRTTAGAELTSSSFHGTMSDDGRYVVFQNADNNVVGAADTNTALDVFVLDITGNSVRRFSDDNAGVVGNQRSFAPLISGDGRFVGFSSDATNLIANDNNAAQDAFADSNPFFR